MTITTVFLTILTYIIDADLDDDIFSSWPHFTIAVIQYLKDNSFDSLCIVVALLFMSWVGLKFGDPWIWDKLQFILDQYKGKAFKSSDPRSDQHNRITLFKHRKFIGFRMCPTGTWKKPWNGHDITGGWLVPVLRSGHIAQKTSAVFAAPDDADRAEGIAGQAWSSQRVIIVDDLNPIGESTSIANKERYASKTNSSVAMVEQYTRPSRIAPRSIVAIPLEVDSQVWGVIVLDSRDPKGVNEDAVENYRLTAATISQLLERA